MSTVEAKLHGQQTISYFPHTSISGDTWALVGKGTCTGNGDANGLTIVDTNSDSGGADNHNGKWVLILSGACKGQYRRVSNDDGSGTLTLEGIGFASQIASGVEYAILTTPEPTVVVDSSGGETDMVDGVRLEPDNRLTDAWIGYWACPITGARAGKIARVTNFVAATGTFTLASGLGGALAAGDVVLLRKFIEVENLSYSLGESYVPRPQNRKDFARGDGVIGPRSGTISFSMQATPSGTLAAALSAANQSILGDLISACGYEEVPDASCEIGAGSNTTAIKILTGSWEKFSIGGMVIYNGNARRITGMTDGAGAEDTITVAPALPVAPAAGGTLYATRGYFKSTDGDTGSVGFDVEIDGIRFTITGCKGNVTLKAGPVMALDFSFTVDHWIREYQPSQYRPSAAYTTAAPVLESSQICWIDGVLADIGGLTATLGVTNAAKKVQGAHGINGQAGLHLTNYNAGCTYRELLLSDTELTRDQTWLSRTSRSLFVVWGSHGSTLGFCIPAARLVSDPMPSNADGMIDCPNVIEAQDAGATVDGGGAYAKIPDFAIFFS